MRLHQLMTILIIFAQLFFKSVYCDRESVTSLFSHQSGENFIFVYDDIINEKYVDSMRKLLLRNVSFTYHDKYDQTNELYDGSIPWTAAISPQFLIKTRFWAGVRNCYRNIPIYIIQDRRYLPYLAYGTMLQRGDHTTAFKDLERNDSLFVRVFLTRQTSKNGYSDQTFYDDDDEIILSVQPKFGRIVVWSSNLLTVWRPPSMGYEESEFSVMIKLTPDQELYHSASLTYLKLQEQIQHHKKIPLPYTNHVNKFPIAQNLSLHLVKKIEDKDGNDIAVYDNLFSKDLLDGLRSYIKDYQQGFTQNPYDRASSEEHDNVNSILPFKIEKILNTPYWEAVNILATSLSNVSTWYPYDVSCNLIQHAHHTRIHIDCVHNEFEYTFVLYLNENWNEDMYGETVFFEVNENKNKVINKKNMADTVDTEPYDFLTAVVPKYGRIVIFRNLIPHSARPQAMLYRGARYTFPVKVSTSYLHARAKMLLEALDFKTDDMVEDPLYGPLREGKYQNYLKLDMKEWLEKNYDMMIQAYKKTNEDEIENIYEDLIPSKLRVTL